MSASLLNADNFVLELYKSKSFNEAFWSGLKTAIVIVSFVKMFPLEIKLA